MYKSVFERLDMSTRTMELILVTLSHRYLETDDCYITKKIWAQVQEE